MEFAQLLSSAPDLFLIYQPLPYPTRWIPVIDTPLSHHQSEREHTAHRIVLKQKAHDQKAPRPKPSCNQYIHSSYTFRLV